MGKQSRLICRSINVIGNLRKAHESGLRPLDRAKSVWRKCTRGFRRLPILVFVMLAGVLMMFTSCRNRGDGSDYIFTMELPSNPRTLDPQTAVEPHARLVIANIFDGLLRLCDSGTVVPGVARDFSVSSDLLTYRFYLRDDVYWSDGHDFYVRNTAHDFVFGFRRLFNSAVRSNNSTDFFGIVNSRAIRESELSIDEFEAEYGIELGVYAEDDFTLVVHLEEPDYNFPILMTMPPAFPVNEEFFLQTNGRYGLIDAETSLASNGAFFLREWVYDPWWRYENRIILRRNERNNAYSDYSDITSEDLESSQFGRITPRGIDFFMDRNGGPFAVFAAGNTDCIVVSGENASILKGDNSLNYVESENTVWGLSFNVDGMFANENLRLALTYAVNLSVIDVDGFGFNAADSLFPASVRLGRVLEGGISEELESSEGTSDFRKRTLSHDSDKARELFNSVSRIVAESRPVVIVPVRTENDRILDFVGAINQQWQSQLSLFCNIVPLSQDEFIRRYNSGDFDIAFKGVSATYASKSSILRQVVRQNETAGEYMRLARASGDETRSSEYFRKAEQEILQTAQFSPLAFASEHFFVRRHIEGLIFNPFTGAILFRKAVVS
ncbi:MAG: ABC transporter substrate-binding protein [Oscillospiraceae bacterium]|nr:ABC transporter substrate-binding protein [Oscillospiraceae bacterium]